MLVESPTLEKDNELDRGAFDAPPVCLNSPNEFVGVVRLGVYKFSVNLVGSVEL